MTTRHQEERGFQVAGAAALATRRVLLVAAHTPQWDDVVRALRADDTACTWIDDTATPASVVTSLQEEDAVLVVDLSPDPVRGMTLLTACRRQARTAPVVVVAPNPSIELARRVRLSGAFYLALDPVSPEEMCSVVANAFECLARHRPMGSTYRVKPRVLIVDDDTDFVTAMTSLLESQGYAVSAARSGKEALGKVRSEPPDLIVLDIMMEYDSSGYEVTQALRFSSEFECVRHVPILMVSSIDIDPMTRFSMAGEVDLVTPDGYLTKPVDIVKFLETVKALLGDHAELAPA